MLFRNVLNACLVALATTNSATGEPSIEARLAEDRPIIIAHRTAIIGEHPESSMDWVEAAISQGVDMVHINPQLTADGQYVLMHDATLNRTTNVVDIFPNGRPDGPSRDSRGGKDYVRDYPLAEIRKLKLNGSALTPPTLQEALEAARDAFVLLGLKNYEIESLSAALEGRDTSNLLFFELYYAGTDQTKLRDLGKTTGIGISATLYNTRNALSDLHAIHDQLGPYLRLVSVSSAHVTPEFLERARDLDIYVAISGRDRPEDADLANGGDATLWLSQLREADAAFTAYPLELLHALGN